MQLYLEVYRKFWSNIHYRRVLCSLPSVMIWDDHDIIDGWGSTHDSFLENSTDFKPEWMRLFKSAASAFSAMQASRNPKPLAKKEEEGFDCCFMVGPYGFVLLDLRTNRNLLKNQLMSLLQFQRVQNWLEANRRSMRALFVISPVVFSHGTPVIDDFFVGWWPGVMALIDWLAKKYRWGSGMRTKFSKSLGDIRDDILDSWGVKENAQQADLLLDLLFKVQNDAEHRVPVVILSGDIHTSGYATIYSADERHEAQSSIPHITSSAISYAPFNWLLEAIYRRASKTVALGKTGNYASQISHHFCARSVAILSIRPKAEEARQLKVKFYLEGYPEPQILLLELDKASHRENITWVAQEKLFVKEYAPTAAIDVEATLRERAETYRGKLNYQQSIVDLMKLLDMDSGLGARKRLAFQLGYPGILDGSSKMNAWLHKRVMDELKKHGGELPKGT